MDVFDKYGVKRDLDWLRQKYGNVQFLDAGLGRKFKLARVDETEGPALIKVRVIGSDSLPQSYQPVANHWPSPALPDLRNAGLKTTWRDRAIFQETDGAGFSGFGLGTGSYIRDLAEGGPHVIWVLSPSLPSDGLSGVGMLGGTNHAGPLFLTFQIGEDEIPATSLEELLLRTGEQKQVIQFNPDAALQKQIFLDDFVPNSGEFDVVWDNNEYVAQRAENLGSGEVRVYYVPVNDWGDVDYIVR